MAPGLVAMAWLALAAPSLRAPLATSCLFRGKAPAGMMTSRAEACRAVLEGLGEDHADAALTITISFAPPATATVTFGGGGHAPISIAIGDTATRRRDFFALGRTIALLMQAY